jgi:D-alanyl-D-alanine carboxypeptidase (penicillin-binding protein 5/6)
MMMRLMLVRGLVVAAVVGLTGGAEAKTTSKAESARTAPARTTAKSGKPAKASSGRAVIASRVRDPYLGAIVVDAATGLALFEKGADEPGYPASVIKLMDLLLIQERIEAGQLSLSNRVTVTAEASRLGGSQVFLAEKESFTIEDLIYALMIQSANDAATALALHVGGTTAGFVELMNGKAAELGMTNTHFYSCHGLPPAAGGMPDTSTARDLARLARELLKHPDILRYTSTRERGFRDDKFIMRTHNHLLTEVEGCDGLKTGFFKAGGYSIVGTAERGGRRVICAVLGSPTYQGRDAQARELIAKGFLSLPPLPPPVSVPANAGMTNAFIDPVAEPEGETGGFWSRWAGRLALGALAVVILGGIGVWVVRRFHRGDL